MNTQQQSGQDQSGQKQQSGQNFGSVSKQDVQSLIGKIESPNTQQHGFQCTADQAMNTILPALRAMNQQL